MQEQAFDRVHRLGQFRDVNIIKLTMTDTVEEKILAVSTSYICTRLLSNLRYKPRSRRGRLG